MMTSRFIPILLVLGVSTLSGGCVLVRKGAARVAAPVATQLSDGLMRQSDVELVRDGAPAFLLMLDAMAEGHPGNPTILLAAAEAQLAYATAFVEKGSRSRSMYQKARDYGLLALSRNKSFAAALEGSIDDFERALGRFRKRDAHALLTTATAWAFWVTASADSPAAFGQMPRVLAMMERVRQLDPDIRQGALDQFYGIYSTVMPPGGGRDLDKARAHFEHSMAIAGPDYLLNRVVFAEFYARYAFDEDLFLSTLTEVLEAEPDAPEFTLMNSVAKQRARALLDQMEELF